MNERIHEIDINVREILITLDIRKIGHYWRCKYIKNDGCV